MQDSENVHGELSTLDVSPTCQTKFEISVPGSGAGTAVGGSKREALFEKNLGQIGHR